MLMEKAKIFKWVLYTPWQSRLDVYSKISKETVQLFLKDAICDVAEQLNMPYSELYEMTQTFNELLFKDIETHRYFSNIEYLKKSLYLPDVQYFLENKPNFSELTNAILALSIDKRKEILQKMLLIISSSTELSDFPFTGNPNETPKYNFSWIPCTDWDKNLIEQHSYYGIWNSDPKIYFCIDLENLRNATYNKMYQLTKDMNISLFELYPIIKKKNESFFEQIHIKMHIEKDSEEELIQIEESFLIPDVEAYLKERTEESINLERIYTQIMCLNKPDFCNLIATLICN